MTSAILLTLALHAAPPPLTLRLEPPRDRLGVALVALDVALAADAVTTILAVRAGGAEANPMWRWGNARPGWMAAAQAAEKVFVHLAVTRWKSRKVAWWIAGVRGGMAAWNVYQIRRSAQ